MKILGYQNINPSKIIPTETIPKSAPYFATPTVGISVTLADAVAVGPDVADGPGVAVGPPVGVGVGEAPGAVQQLLWEGFVLQAVTNSGNVQ